MKNKSGSRTVRYFVVIHKVSLSILVLKDGQDGQEVKLQDASFAALRQAHRALIFAAMSQNEGVGKFQSKIEVLTLKNNGFKLVFRREMWLLISKFST